MFVEVHNAVGLNESSPKLGFVKSLNASVFPSGRRRSELVDFDGHGDDLVSTNEMYHIPYDPESRLNTEANNMKHSGINGFTQTYIKEWDFEHFLFSIGGYLFNLNTQYESQASLGYTSVYDAFGKTFSGQVDTWGTCIYANIRLESVPLYEGFKKYNTTILRDQTSEVNPKTSLDVIISDLATTDALRNTPTECFYFSGLSFSSTPLALIDTEGKITNTDKNTWKTIETRKIYDDEGQVYQQVISLKILNKIDDTWFLNQSAVIPNIQHGPIEDSIKVGTVFADAMAVGNDPVPALKLIQDSVDPSTYKLCFTAAGLQYNTDEASDT